MDFSNFLSRNIWRIFLNKLHNQIIGCKTISYFEKHLKAKEKLKAIKNDKMKNQ